MNNKLPPLFSFLLFTVFLVLFHSARAQFALMDYSPKVVVDGDTLKMPWVGGMNQPQFSQMDLNEDGVDDLFVFDRSGFKKLFFLATKEGGDVTYNYDPSFEDRFPNAEQFMVLRDGNCDNVPDLWYNDGQYTYLSMRQSVNDGFLFERPNDSLTAFWYYDDFTQREVHTTLGQFAGNFPGIADVDLDGDVDYLTNRDLCLSSIAYYQNTTLDRKLNCSDTSTFEIPDFCWGNIGENNKAQIIINPTCFFTRRYQYFAKKHCGTKTILVWDMDGDGDSDLFFGNSEAVTTPVIYAENGKKDLNHPIDTMIRIDTSFFSNEVMRHIPLAAAGHKVDVNLDGKMDLIFATNESFPEGKINQTNQVATFFNTGTTNSPVLTYQDNSFLVGDMVDLGGEVMPALVDIDGDNDFDLIVATNGDQALTGDSMDRLVFFENVGSAQSPMFHLRDTNFLNLASSKYRGMKISFGDLNSDNKVDLAVGTSNQGLFLYLNQSDGTNYDFVQFNKNLDNFTDQAIAPCLYDVDNDGLTDLILGEYYGSVKYYRNEGSAVTPDFVLKDNLMGDTLINELRLTTLIRNNKEYDTLVYATVGNSVPIMGDIEGDGNLDLVVGTIQGKVVKMTLDGRKVSGKYTISRDFFTFNDKGSVLLDLGSYSTPAFADLNKDGIADFVIGNSRGGLNFFLGVKSVHVEDESSSNQNPLLYPNPAQQVVKIELTEKSHWKVFNLQGQLMLAGTSDEGQTQIDVSTWTNGLYFIQYHQGEVTTQSKFVVLH